MSEERCECGKLLLRKTPEGFEFKCNRCKRIHLIPFDEIEKEYQDLCPVTRREGQKSTTGKSAKPGKEVEKKTD